MDGWIDGELPNLAVLRFNIRGYSWTEQGYVYRSASNGCKINCYNPVIDGNVSVLSQGTGIASTWNKNLIFQSGECPILTGEIAVAFNKVLMGYAK
ncbi:unnamed protein product [Rotaria sp. Silwood1]|nr:unnamed protein product [Rotaria sp. Silwood1]CAF1647451.1 unnamed protein product [Rotaria sp. Silwood1]